MKRAMKAIVLDKQGRKIDELSGVIDNGMFTYKKGAFLGFGGKKEEEECDYDKLIPVYWSIMWGLLKGSQKRLYYEYRNGRLTQLSWTEVSKTSVFSDANNAWKQMTYAEEATLKRPTSGIENLIPWLLMAVVIIAVGTMAFVANNASTNISKATSPITNISKILNEQSTQLIGINNRTDTIFNRTLDICSEVLAKESLTT